MFRNFLDLVDRAEVDCDEVFLDLAFAWARREHPKQADRLKPVDTLLSLPERQPDTGMRQVISYFNGIPVRWTVVADN